MKSLFLKYIYKINAYSSIILVAYSILFSVDYKIWGVFLLLNGIFSLILLLFNASPLWLGFGGFNYTLEKLLKERDYNTYLNLFMGIICLIFGALILIN